MYEKFFGFKLPPFANSPELQQLYFAETHSEALARLVYGMLARKPLIILTGDVGLGKSTMLRASLSRVTAHQSLRVVALPHPLLRPGDVLRYIGRELGMANAQQLRVSDLDVVHDAMKKLVAEGQRLALVIDEAQSLPAETLEFVRLMSNLDTGLSGQFQIVLVGQPELWDLLQKTEFRHLRQRIAIRAELLPLSKSESHEYLRHRLKHAGAVIEQIFTRSAIKALIREGHGAPRRLNCIADNALLLAFGDQRKPVDVDQVISAAATQDKVGDGVLGWRRWLRKPLVWITVPALAVIAFVTVAIILYPSRTAPRTTAAGQESDELRSRTNPDASAAQSPGQNGGNPPASASAPGSTPAVNDLRDATTAQPAPVPADTPTQTETAAAATLSPSRPAISHPAATSSRQRISQ